MGRKKKSNWFSNALFLFPLPEIEQCVAEGETHNIQMSEIERGDGCRMDGYLQVCLLCTLVFVPSSICACKPWDLNFPPHLYPSTCSFILSPTYLPNQLQGGEGGRKFSFCSRKILSAQWSSRARLVCLP